MSEGKQRGVRPPAWSRWALGLLAAGAAGLAVSACGGGGPSAAPVYIASGQIPKADLPTGDGKGGKDAGVTATTIPLAEQNPTTALFSAIGAFQSCLTGTGQGFIGIPDPNLGSGAAVNNPAYLKALTTCAAQSNILQALKVAQSAQSNLTPAQVKTENKEYLRWRTCMIARGWGIPEPKPNQKGLLFSFSATTGGASSGTGQDIGGFKPPPGQNILSSPDLQACAAKAEIGSSLSQ